MTYEVETQSGTSQVTVEAKDSGFLVAVDGSEPVFVDVREPSSGVWSVLSEGRSYEVGIEREEDSWSIDIYGSNHIVRAMDPRRKALRLAGGSDQGLLKTSMPGRVVRLLVSEGQAVERGEAVIVVEAMKMENEMKAPAGGVVSSVYVEEGQAVEAGASLILVE